MRRHSLLVFIGWIALSGSNTRAAQAGDISPVSVMSRTFVDAQGRARFFRGVNVVFKDPPYFPSVVDFDPNLSFMEVDVDLLASMGVNLVRLGVMWPGVFPERGRPDLAYLEKVLKTPCRFPPQ